MGEYFHSCGVRSILLGTLGDNVLKLSSKGIGKQSPMPENKNFGEVGVLYFENDYDDVIMKVCDAFAILIPRTKASIGVSTASE